MAARRRAAARNSGTCTNRKTIARSEVESRVLDGLRHQLLRPDMIASFLADLREALQEERLAALQARAGAERRLHGVTRSITAVVDAIAAGMFHPSMKAKMDALEAERARLEAELGALPAPDPVALHPGLVDAYAGKVAQLAETLNAPDTRAEATEILRGLIEKIVLHPEPGAPGGHAIDLFGELGAILSFCGEGTNAKARTGGAGVRQGTMVAGAGSDQDLPSAQVKMVAGTRFSLNLLTRSAA